MPTNELFALLLNRLSEERLLRLAEVRYLTSFIQELETRRDPENTTRPAVNRRNTDNDEPALSSIEEAERLFIEERGYLNARRTTNNERPVTAPVNTPERIIAGARNNRFSRRQRTRQATQARQRPARVHNSGSRPYSTNSLLVRRPNASQVRQAGDIVTNRVAELLSEDIIERASAHAVNTVRRSDTNSRRNSSRRET